jgi:hypothetical protein
MILAIVLAILFGAQPSSPIYGPPVPLCRSIELPQDWPMDPCGMFYPVEPLRGTIHAA